jgi:hypothetical protein
MPQCQFPISAVFVFQKSYTGNILGIGRDKSQNSYFSRSVMESKAETEGHHRAAAPWHGAGHPLAAPGGGVGPWPTPWRRPSAYIFPSTGKPKGPDQFSTKPTVSHRRHRHEIGRVQKLFLAPCRRGESPPEAFFITMATLDYGSIALARWLSSPTCASCLDLVSCLSWSRSSLCNSTYCVCWDPMNIGTMSSWIVDLSSLCYLYVVYDLACSPLLVDILAE